ncbi:hypothetical protein GCM10009853_025510 [Glycomyces scopariae]|uniref:Uncharacterized protein n=1 Tax=Glycomyces sambucus TaxID=380244 RepID=A0A1G9M3Y9_9ACTN|nr:hypothetical protein [Glycomyces sambucus]SDL68671.1 hypothetical protein SAMN05216298_4803 [Glycomyces sambucus]
MPRLDCPEGSAGEGGAFDGSGRLVRRAGSGPVKHRAARWRSRRFRTRPLGVHGDADAP